MKTPTIDFVGGTKRWVSISAVLLLLAVGALLIRGLDLSIEFVGGTSYTLEQVDPDITSSELRNAAEDAGAQDVIAQLQTEGGQTAGAIVRTEAVQPGSGPDQEIRAALEEVSDSERITAEFVGPFWGEQITRQAIEALVVFLVIVTIYISFRLEFKMAVAALIALAHDLVITVGLYALVGFTVSPATVIAILTILGYSLYDTVVVFDRVKENSFSLGEPGRRTYAQLVNTSMNEVVWRSINTSITSLMPVGALLFIGAQLLGADTLQDLALALFIGMAIGIFSSLFVAGPFFAWWRMRDPDQQRAAAKVAARSGGGAAAAEREAVEAEVAEEAEEQVADEDLSAGTPESRAPITTEYVRGEGKRKKRRKR
jgi:preprotein translocase subunit SecF